LKLLFQSGDQYVGRDGASGLRFDGVLAAAGVDESQDRATNAVTNAHAVEFVGMYIERAFHVSENFSPGQLCKGYDSKLLGTAQPTNPDVATTAIDNVATARLGHELHELRKQGLADVHEPLPKVLSLRQYPIMKDSISSRHQKISSRKAYQCWFSLKNLPVKPDTRFITIIEETTQCTNQA